MRFDFKIDYFRVIFTFIFIGSDGCIADLVSLFKTPARTVSSHIENDEKRHTEQNEGRIGNEDRVGIVSPPTPRRPRRPTIDLDQSAINDFPPEGNIFMQF